ncbi:DinB family protein [Allomuricauda sp. SCSIO 65647]|uniref:DinB family protein n=1 Tax=Allomuricauda sp. SCSIO 65647 TaxID=2908843 RepID=UPI001F437D02|nr:DinB family protein [Muricauda sp. SCSIO 65647]UJH66046.1 hypothetical protein L0P89_08665 [Muricauda sp. SCSIO 65647]
MKPCLSVLFLFLIINVQAQEMGLPYHQIPDYPSEYTSGNIVSRLVDGLGFRYYWATDGLTPSDLDYKPSEEARTVMETLQHIHSMSETILNAPSATPNVQPKDFGHYSFDELRKKTLENLQAASKLYSAMQDDDFENSKVIFQRGDKKSDFPFWNMLNGMLSDCIYHTGQIVLMRRANGNPKNPNVSVFLGKIRE